MDAPTVNRCAHCRKTRFFYPMPFAYSIMRFLHDRDFSQIRGRFAQERTRSTVHRVREKSRFLDEGRPPDRRRKPDDSRPARLLDG
ncbi:hypothetical protein [Burkholderia lata]|uniref:hypothetical protein n=1 Tax=Burkholderia lata (strain ATCC 17760 / DSM 23089 / LMG 22485 / NCIMB 9086 / R18194 / 383) TaxID=482957 RepID=UPI0018D342DA|nr:hypothetical protein [Burkholderia lata]